ncbi:hypothetical protein ACFS32_07440 [Novosphingobium pokkalii]|uniref:hypothetical protein n=1 Tax=Novosphingobium pokkalii TaxID=1770194 RepID=UPI003624B486
MAALAGVAIGPGAVTLAPAEHALLPAVQAAPAATLPQPLRDEASGPTSEGASGLLDGANTPGKTWPMPPGARCGSNSA